MYVCVCGGVESLRFINDKGSAISCVCRKLKGMRWAVCLCMCVCLCVCVYVCVFVCVYVCVLRGVG